LISQEDCWTAHFSMGSAKLQVDRVHRGCVGIFSAAATIDKLAYVRGRSNPAAPPWSALGALWGSNCHQTSSRWESRRRSVYADIASSGSKLL